MTTESPAGADRVCYIGIGSNLGDSQQHVREAVAALDSLVGTQLSNVSSLYLSDPLGPADQPRYVNAVAEISTELSPIELLDALQNIEKSHGRERGRRWGARTLDLDVLLYGDLELQSDRLSVPHSGIASRSFVLLPLVEIAPDVVIPHLGKAAALVKSVPDLGIEKLSVSLLPGT